MIRRTALWLIRLNPTSAELVLAGAAVVFGLALLVPVDLSVRSPAFRQLAEMGPQLAWAGVWLALGLMQAVSAVWGVGRRQADVAAASLWLFWTVVQLLAMGLTVGPFSYGWLALASLAASHLDRHSDGVG